MMSSESWHIFAMFGFFAVLLSVSGLYCILVTRNLIRTIIGLELLIKAVTLFLIMVGYVTDRVALAQSIVITIIVIEVVIIAVAAGLSLQVFRHNDDLDVRRLQKLKG